MPPSLASESLERHLSTESIKSVSSRLDRPITSPKEGEPSGQRTVTMAGGSQAVAHVPYSGHTGTKTRHDDNGDGYNGIDIFERPSWIESLQRLKICCPGIPGIPHNNKQGYETRVRSHSESTSSSKSSRQPSPIAIAPAYHCWDATPNPQMIYPSVPPPAYFAQHGYPHPPPYLPNGYPHSWGYPPPNAAPSYPVPSPHHHTGMPYPAIPQLFHNKTVGYAAPHNGAPMVVGTTGQEPVLLSQQQPYDSGTESEVSLHSHRRQQSASKPKQRQTSKPPLVQRRATAPAQSSPFASTHKQSIDQPLVPPNLPPKQPSSHKNVTGLRPRLPSEMSRNSVGTTSSRHRRQVHETFEFSTNSLREIAGEAPLSVGPPPLNFIEVQPSFGRTNSWSSWDDHTHNESDHSLLLSPDEEDIVGYISPVDEEGGHAPAPPAQKPAEWMLQWAAQDKTAVKETPPSPASRTSRASEAPPVPTKDTVARPVYLPVSPDRDQMAVSAGEALVFSGWVAMSEGDTMRNQIGLAEGKEVPIQYADICYLQLVQHESRYKLKVHQLESGETRIVPLSRALQAQSQEISGRAGRCIILQDAWARRILWTILPVSLPPFFFRQGKFISQRHFTLLQSSMFTPFYNATMGMPQEWSEEYCNMRYAPDEQHDAAMHILFSLDAALSSSPL